MTGLRITCLRRTDAGYWTAHVSAAGETVPVDLRYGSWQTTQKAPERDSGAIRRDVLPGVAAELQRRVKVAERREKRRLTEGTVTER